MWDNPRRSGLWCEVGPIRGTAPKQQRLVTLKQQYRKATNVLKKGGADPETGENQRPGHALGGSIFRRMEAVAY